MEPVSRFGSGPWASSSSLVTRRGFRRFSFKKKRGWGAARRRGRCCTSFGQDCRPFRRATPYEQHLLSNIFWATSSGRHRGRRDLHRGASARGGTDVVPVMSGWPSRKRARVPCPPRGFVFLSLTAMPRLSSSRAPPPPGGRKTRFPGRSTGYSAPGSREAAPPGPHREIRIRPPS